MPGYAQQINVQCTLHIAQGTLDLMLGYTQQINVHCTAAYKEQGAIANGILHKTHYKYATALYTLRPAIHSMLIVDAWPPVRNDNASHPDSIKDNSNAHLTRSFFALKTPS